MRTPPRPLSQYSQLICKRASNAVGRFIIDPPVVTAEHVTLRYEVFMDFVYVCAAERDYPSLCAFTFLRELADTFTSDPSRVKAAQAAVRPFALMAFEETVRRLLRNYASPNTLQARVNVPMVAADLKQVKRVCVMELFMVGFVWICIVHLLCMRVWHVSA